MRLLHLSSILQVLAVLSSATDLNPLNKRLVVNGTDCSQCDNPRTNGLWCIVDCGKSYIPSTSARVEKRMKTDCSTCNSPHRDKLWCNVDCGTPFSPKERKRRMKRSMPDMPGECAKKCGTALPGCYTQCVGAQTSEWSPADATQACQSTCSRSASAKEQRACHLHCVIESGVPETATNDQSQLFTSSNQHYQEALTSTILLYQTSSTTAPAPPAPSSLPKVQGCFMQKLLQQQQEHPDTGIRPRCSKTWPAAFHSQDNLDLTGTATSLPLLKFGMLKASPDQDATAFHSSLKHKRYWKTQEEATDSNNTGLRSLVSSSSKLNVIDSVDAYFPPVATIVVAFLFFIL